MNNLATRCIAVLLSSLMIWTSVAPSYAQALDAVRQDKNLAETLSSHISDAIGQSQSKSAQLEEIKQLVSSMQAQAENKTGAKTLALEEVDLANKKQVKDAFEKTYQEFLSDKESRKELDRAVEEAYARAFYDVFDKEFKQQFFEDNKDVNKAELASKYQALRQKAFADYKEEHLIDFQNFHKAYLAASKAQMEQEFPALLNKYQRLAREEENKYLQNLFAEVWRSYYPNKSKEVLDFMSMEAMPVFKMAGLTSAEQEREMAGYLRGIIKQDGVACEGVKKLIPSKKATEQASGRCARALSAILPLGIVGQEANGSDRADAALISDLMQRSEQAIAGTEVFMAGVSALIGLKGDKELATILVYAPIPVRWRQSYEKEALNWISDGMFHPITKTVQIAAANVHDEWEYDSFAQNIENSFYDENSAKPGNIFYDLGAFLTEQSAKDAAAKSVLEKVMRTNLKYSWDTASRNQDIYPSMPFKMFMMGALSKGYRVSINVGDHFRTGKPKITDAYGVTWDAAQFKKWHEADAYRMANWACGRSGNLHTPNGISQTGFVLSGLLTKLDKDTSLPPGVYKWVKTELTNAYNKELRACDAAFKSSAQAGDEKYAVLHKTGSQAKLPGDADVQAYSAKYDASQAKLKRADRWGAGARWTAFAIDMALLLWLVWDIVIVGLRGIVTSGRSVYLVVKDARAMQGTARVRSLLRSQRLARYGTSSGWKVFKGKTNFNLAKLKLDLTPDSLLSVAQKEAMQSMRGSYAAYLRTSSAAASGKAPATLPEVFPQSQWERAAALTKQELPLVSEIPAKIRSRASARADFADKNMLYELGPAVSEKRAADQKALIDWHRSNGTLIERDGYLYAAKGQKLPSSLVPVEQGLLAKPVDPAIQQARLAKEAQVRANFAAKNDLYELGRKIQVKDDPAVIWHRNTGSLVEHEGYLYGRKDVMAQMPKVLTEDLEAAKVIQQTTLDKVTLGRASKFKNLVHKTKMAVSTFLTSAMLVTASPAAQAHLASPVQTEMVAAVAATPVEASPIILDPAVAEKGRAGALIMGGRSSTVASVEQIAEKLAVQRLAQPEQFKAFQLFMENKQAMQLARNAVVLNGMREGVSPFWNKYQLAMYDFSHPFEGVRQKIAESRLSNNVFYQEYLRTVQAEEELAAQREAEARELERQARQMEGQLRPAYASGYLYSGLPVQKIVESTAANTRARTILSAPTPLLTDLRSILNGQASVTYKKRALLSLYRQGALDKTIRNFSKDVKEKLDRAELESRYTDSTDKLENVLFNLWNLGFFTKAINGLRNLAMGESSQLLQSITADESFAVESRAIYDQTPVLSPQSALFAGVVSSLKGVDKALVLAGTRENGFALKNAGNGTTKGGYVYYANNIPVYFRNVQGNISAQPVAILTQPQSTWFAKALSRVGLSSPLGVRVPKGMVLAIDETGKWKFVRMPGFEEDIQQSKPSRKIQAEIYEKGSAPKALDTPYSTTDMLAIAKMLDADPNINFQLLLNPSSSFQQFINAMALGIGLNADGVLTGPLKRTVNSTAGAEGISGIGYVTPWIAGWALPRMTNWGIGKSLAVILSVSTAALAVSWGLLGFNGQVVLDAAGHAIPYSLAKLAVPMVVMVLGASLMRTIKSLVLNYNKDPQTRTRAFLRFSSFQQASRAALAGITFLWTLDAFGGNSHDAFVAIPIATALFGLTLTLFTNTPLFREIFGVKSQADLVRASVNLGQEEKAQTQAPKENIDTAAEEAQDKASYKNEFLKIPEIRSVKWRVSMVYATYAATVMLMNQLASTLSPAGQFFVMASYLASLWMRTSSSRWMGRGRFTDDQLTGVSILGLALTSGAMAVMPYASGGLALGLLAAVGILHSVSTAVPGQLDDARLQNMVTAEMQKAKNQVLANTELSDAEKAAAIARIERQEKRWASSAGKSYSFYNGMGIIGIGVAVLLGFLVGDWSPDFINAAQDAVANIFNVEVLQSGDVSKIVGREHTAFLARLIFAYGAVVASLATVKNWDMVTSFFNTFRKNNVTQDAIDAGKVSARTFSMTKANVERTLVTLKKDKKTGMDGLQEMLGPTNSSTLASETKMTEILKNMKRIHNRLVAATELLNRDAVEPYFKQFHGLLKQYQNTLHDGLTVALHREFEKLVVASCVDGDVNTGLLASPRYIAEGNYNRPQGYDKFLHAQDLFKELEYLSNEIKTNKDSLSRNTYKLFVKYYGQAHEELLQYQTLNPSESRMVRMWEQHLDDIGRDLKAYMDSHAEEIAQHEELIPAADIQAVKDILSPYSKDNASNGGSTGGNVYSAAGPVSALALSAVSMAQSPAGRQISAKLKDLIQRAKRRTVNKRNPGNVYSFVEPVSAAVFNIVRVLKKTSQEKKINEFVERVNDAVAKMDDMDGYLSAFGTLEKQQEVYVTTWLEEAQDQLAESGLSGEVQAAFLEEMRALWEQELAPEVVAEDLAAEDMAEVPAYDEYETGEDALKEYLPNWRADLGAKLSPRQLDVVAEAFAITDKIVFAEGNKTDWNYRDIFEQKFAGLAQEKNIAFSKAQENAVTGKYSYFGKLFMLESVYGSLYALGRYPQGYQGQKNLTKEQLQERALNVGVRMAILNAKKSDRMDSTIEKLEEIQQANLLIAGRKTPAQWLDELDLFIKQNKRFPIRYLNPKTDAQKRELALYRGVHHAVYNAKPTDSDERKAAVERMKNLWDLREAAQRGDITWDEALGKLVVKHKRPRINKQDSAETIAKRETEQKAYEQQLQAQADEITKEVSPAVMKGVYEDLIDVSKQDKRLLEAFPSWLQKTYKYFITTKNGTVALDALVRKSKVWNDKIGEDYALDPSEKAEFDNVMESIKEIYMTEGLGAQDNGYMRWLYVGQNPQIPQPDDWHLMQEMKGVPVVGIDWEKEFPHIVQSVKGGDLVRVQLLSGVTAQEIDKLIDAMLLDGYTVRMGNHELGISGNRATDNFRNGRLHLHIEQTELEEYDQTAYVSYVLDIDASQIVQGKNNQGIAATYRKLFGRYISSDNALYQIR